MESIQIDDLFSLTHCAFLNPLNPTEVVTANGLVGVIGRGSAGSKQLYVVSDKGKVNTKDPTQTFDVIRPLYTHFSQDGRSMQLLRVTGEVDLTLNRRQVHAVFLSSPINFPGSPWKQRSTSDSDHLIDFLSSQRTTSSSNNGSISSISTLKNGTGNGATSSPIVSPSNTQTPPSSASTPTKSKPKAGAEEASFLNRLKAAPEVKQLLTDFIHRFSSKPPGPEEQGQIIRSFLDEVLGMMMNHRAWTNAMMEDMEIAAEAAEKYIMQKVYKFCFSSTPQDINRDKALSQRFAELQFITFDHLDISTHHRDSQRINLAIEELRQINGSKTPRGKLTRILNCCKAIYSILNRAAQRGHTAAGGADEFLPLLNYVVLKANPSQLHSNVQFILRFRAPNKMITEAGYYFTHLESTITWLETVNASKLTIDAETFDHLLEQTREQAKSALLAPKIPLVSAPKPQSSDSLFTSLNGSNASLTPSLTSSPASDHYGGGIPTASPASRSNHHDLLDLSGLSDSVTPTPTPPPDLSWSTPMTLSRVSSGSRSVTRDDESSEASVLEIQDAESPLRFLNFSSVTDIRVGELEDLFQAYRMLAHENFQLRTDLYRNANKIGP